MLIELKTSFICFFILCFSGLKKVICNDVGQAIISDDEKMLTPTMPNVQGLKITEDELQAQIDRMMESMKNRSGAGEFDKESFKEDKKVEDLANKVEDLTNKVEDLSAKISKLDSTEVNEKTVLESEPSHKGFANAEIKTESFDEGTFNGSENKSSKEIRSVDQEQLNEVVKTESFDDEIFLKSSEEQSFAKEEEILKTDILNSFDDEIFIKDSGDQNDAAADDADDKLEVNPNSIAEDGFNREKQKIPFDDDFLKKVEMTSSATSTFTEEVFFDVNEDEDEDARNPATTYIAPSVTVEIPITHAIDFEEEYSFRVNSDNEKRHEILYENSNVSFHLKKYASLLMVKGNQFGLLAKGISATYGKIFYDNGLNFSKEGFKYCNIYGKAALKTSSKYGKKGLKIGRRFGRKLYKNLYRFSKENIPIILDITKEKSILLTNYVKSSYSSLYEKITKKKKLD